MSENDDRTEEGSRAVERLKDGVEVVGGGEGKNEDNLDTAAEAVVPNVVAVPRSYNDQEVNDMTPDQAQAAAARASLMAPQMQRRLGGPPLSNKELLRRLLAVAPIGASAATAAAEAKAAAESKAAEGDNGFPGLNGLGSGSSAAIESVLRGRLQGPGHSGASGIANLAAGLPTTRGIAVVLTFL